MPNIGLQAMSTNKGYADGYGRRSPRQFKHEDMQMAYERGYVEGAKARFNYDNMKETDNA